MALLPFSSAPIQKTAVTPGSYTSTNLTVNAYGQITTATNGSGGGVTINTNTLKIDQTGGGTTTYGALAGTVNGTNAVFTVSNGSYVSGTLQIFLNGQEQTLGSTGDCTETTPGSGTFTFAIAPPTGSVIIAGYITQISTSGNFALPIRTVTANATISATADHTILVDATSGPISITYPSAGSATGLEFVVKKIDASANAVTLVATIDGVASPTLATQYKFNRAQSNGTAYYGVGNN